MTFVKIDILWAEDEEQNLTPSYVFNPRYKASIAKQLTKAKAKEELRKLSISFSPTKNKR